MSCWQCRNDLSQSLVTGTFHVPLTFDYGNNYCSNCGESLRETCYSCDGRGTKTEHNGYCPNCGTARTKTVKCSNCNGSGKTTKTFCCARVPGSLF